MKFTEAIHSTPSLMGALQSGLKALKTNSGYVVCNNPRTITGSLDLDSTLKDDLPNDPRWDYGVGQKLGRPGQNGEKIWWIEIHPASSTHVQPIIDKALWLRQWLRDNAPLLCEFPSELVWVSTGKVFIQASSPQARKLAMHGVRFAGKRLTL
jgi:hypothetical protein